MKLLFLPLLYTLGSAFWVTPVVDFYINPTNPYVSEQEAINALRFGAEAWTNQSNANIQLRYAGLSTATSTGFNSKNEMIFQDDPDNQFIAVTKSWWFGTNKIDSDHLYNTLRIFFTGDSGCSGGWYLEDISIHEFGHTLGLSHSSVSGATMWPSINGCQQHFRTLHQDDIDGIEFIYPSSGIITPSGLQVR